MTSVNDMHVHPPCFSVTTNLKTSGGGGGGGGGGGVAQHSVKFNQGRWRKSSPSWAQTHDFTATQQISNFRNTARHSHARTSDSGHELANSTLGYRASQLSNLGSLPIESQPSRVYHSAEATK